jgi:hypothetical protein
MTHRDEQSMRRRAKSTHIDADSALTWLTCGRTFPAAQKCRFGAGRIDSAHLAAIMVLIYGWRRGPDRVSGHVQETLAARGNLAVACEAAGGPGPGHPPCARLMTCANT